MSHKCWFQSSYLFKLPFEDTVLFWNNCNVIWKYLTPVNVNATVGFCSDSQLKGMFNFQKRLLEIKDSIIFLIQIHNLQVKKPLLKGAHVHGGFWGTQFSVSFLKSFSPGFSHSPSPTIIRKANHLCILNIVCFVVHGVKTPSATKEQGTNALLLKRSHCKQGKKYYGSRACSMQVKGIRTCHPQICHFGLLMILSWTNEKHPIQGALCPSLNLCLKAGHKFSFVKVTNFHL